MADAHLNGSLNLPSAGAGSRPWVPRLQQVPQLEMGIAELLEIQARVHV